MKMIIKFVSTFKHIINLSACQSKNFKITKIGPCITTRSLQNIFIYFFMQFHFSQLDTNCQ